MLGVSQRWQMLHVECQALKGDKVLKSLNVMRPNEPTSQVTVLRVRGFLLPQALQLPVFQQPRIWPRMWLKCCQRHFNDVSKFRPWRCPSALGDAWAVPPFLDNSFGKWPGEFQIMVNTGTLPIRESGSIGSNSLQCYFPSLCKAFMTWILWNGNKLCRPKQTSLNEWYVYHNCLRCGENCMKIPVNRGLADSRSSHYSISAMCLAGTACWQIQRCIQPGDLAFFYPTWSTGDLAVFFRSWRKMEKKRIVVYNTNDNKMLAKKTFCCVKYMVWYYESGYNLILRFCINSILILFFKVFMILFTDMLKLE